MTTLRAPENNLTVAKEHDMAGTRFTALSLSFLLAFLPVFVDVARAQQPEITALLDSQASSSVAVTHVSVERGADGRGVITATVASGNRSADVEIRGRDLKFAGGYSLVVRDLASTPTQKVVQLIGQSPDGRAERAVIRYDVRTQAFSDSGVDKVNALLAGSGVLDLVTAAMPLVTSMAKDVMSRSNSGSGARISSSQYFGDPESDGWLACAGASLLLLSAALAVIVACGTPEPAQPIACYAAWLGLVGAFLMAVDACSE